MDLTKLCYDENDGDFGSRCCADVVQIGDLSNADVFGKLTVDVDCCDTA